MYWEKSSNHDRIPPSGTGKPESRTASGRPERSNTVSVKVRIPSQLRQLTGGEGMIEMDPGTIGGIIMELENLNPGIAERLLDNGEVRRFINIYIDGDDIRFADGMETEVADGAEVSIVPAVAGG